jgi:hypothetical protein
MEFSCKSLAPHPHLLETLFAFKSNVSSVYRDILGIHEINHIAITRITAKNEILVLSSTPAMEFNLFNSSLWRQDQTYSPQWLALNTHEYWHNLYHPSRYDELYYLKQIKHDYPLGISVVEKIDNEWVVYSLASHKSSSETRLLFATEQEDFYKIGRYCFNLLKPIFHQCDVWTPAALGI